MSQQDSTTLTARWDTALMRNYGTPPLELVSGRGAVVTAADGREYLDLLAGIAVNSLGHAHSALLSAISKQAESLGHVSDFFASAPQIELAV